MAAPAASLPGGDCGDCLVGEHVLLLRGAPPPSMAARGGGPAAARFSFEDWIGGADAAEPSRLDRFGETFLFAFLLIQQAAVLLLTPVYAGGAVAEEKEKGRLDFLLTTPLGRWELVAGKLAARLVFELRAPYVLGDKHVVVTGRNAKDELIEIADLVTEMEQVKHPFRAGVKAQAGIEF